MYIKTKWHQMLYSDEKFESQKQTRKSGYGRLSRYLIVLSVFTNVISAYKSWNKKRS